MDAIGYIAGLVLFALVLGIPVASASVGFVARQVWSLQGPSGQAKLPGQTTSKRRVRHMPRHIYVTQSQHRTTDSTMTASWEARSRWVTDGKVTDQHDYPRYSTFTITGATYAYLLCEVFENGQLAEQPMVWKAYATRTARNQLMAELGQFRCMRHGIYWLLVNMWKFSGCYYMPEDTQWLAAHPHFQGAAPMGSGHRLLPS